MVVAVIGIPGNLEIQMESVELLKRKKAFDFVETRPGRLILYWRALPPSFSADFKIETLAKVPGNFRGASSRAYLFYSDEHKVWVDGVEARVVPKGVGSSESPLSRFFAGH